MVASENGRNQVLAKHMSLDRLIILVLLFFVGSCVPFSTEPIPGPDKQAVGTWYGAVLGAGSGAISGFQLGAGTGPGALVGMGFGSVFGMLSGIGTDLIEENELRNRYALRRLNEQAWVHEVLAEHYSRRLELHPDRDIFPADLFFEADSVKLTPAGRLLAREVALLNRYRMPWSRLVIASYVTAGQDSSYAQHLTRRRAEELGLVFVQAGLNPRRVLTRAAILEDPLVYDPFDAPGRYRQAVEIIAMDR